MKQSIKISNQLARNLCRIYNS